MVQKFQQGGTQLGGGILAQIQLMPKELLLLLMQAFALWAQQKGLDIKQLQSNPQVLEQALGQFIQEVQSQLTQAARHGAKLNYIKSLKHQCADDEELYYYKKGGSVGCGCKKKENGGEVKKAQKGSVVLKFKNRKQDLAAKDSIEANVHNNLDILNNVSGKTPGDYKKNKLGKMQWTPDRTKAPYKKVKEGSCGTKMKKK